MIILRTNKYGAGWATWNDSIPELAYEMMTWQPIIKYLENFYQKIEDEDLDLNPDDHDLDENHPLVLEMVETLQKKYNKDHICILGAKNLTLDEYTPPNFLPLQERDGLERIRYR